MAELLNTITERRRNTRSSIFQYIYDSTIPCTKQQLSNALKISLPTVYQDINELISAGFVEVGGQNESAGGRPAISYKVVSNARTAVGLFIDLRKVSFIATDLSKKVTGQKSVPIEVSIRSKNLFAFIAEQLEIFIDEQEIDRTTLLGVGISVPGVVIPDNNTILYSPRLDLHNYSFDYLVKSLPYKVLLENDATSGGFAEWYNSDNNRNMAFLSLSSGVGGTVLVNGAQYKGENNRSGEFGHMCIERNGRKCSCGKLGCFEAYCSTDRLSTALGISLDDFFKRLESGNTEAKSIWNDYSGYLAIALHNIRMFFDCDIVIGGFLSQFLPSHLEELKRAVAKLDPFDNSCNYLRIGITQNQSAAYGVAMMFIKSFLDEL